MAAAARLKELGIPFTLIDKKEYFYHMVGVLRGLVEPGKNNIHTKAFFPIMITLHYSYRISGVIQFKLI